MGGFIIQILLLAPMLLTWEMYVSRLMENLDFETFLFVISLDYLFPISNFFYACIAWRKYYLELFQANVINTSFKSRSKVKCQLYLKKDFPLYSLVKDYIARFDLKVIF